MDADYTKAKQLAEYVLHENNITAPPIPISLIAKNYGLTTGEYDFKDYNSQVAGMIDLNKNIIAFNKNDSVQRQAFTIAHELAHYLLHKEHINSEDGIDILFRKPLGKPDPDWKEQEANCFAANLLVPETWLKEYIKKGYSDTELAKAFGVSVDVIGFRKQFLHLN